MMCWTLESKSFINSTANRAISLDTSAVTFWNWVLLQRKVLEAKTFTKSKALHLELLLLRRLLLLYAFGNSSPILDCLPFISLHTKLNKLPLFDLICLLPLPNLFLLLFLLNVSLVDLHVDYLH